MNEDEEESGGSGDLDAGGESQPATTDTQATVNEPANAPAAAAAATPEPIEENRPATADEYELSDLGEEEAAFFKQQFFDNKLTKSQAEALVKAYKESIEKAEAPLFSADGFKKEMSARFGENYQPQLDKISGFIKAEAAPQDAQLIDKLPNNVIGIVYGLIDKVMTRYAVNDTDTAKTGAGTTGSGEPDYTGFVAAMQTLRGRPHDSAEVAALKKQFHII